MNGSRIDAWTRRRLGFVAGAGVTTLLGLRPFEAAVANKTRKRNHGRCRNVGQRRKHNGNCPNCACCKGFICVDSQCV